MPDLPLPSSVDVSRRMSRQRSRDTDPERAVRRLVHAAGLRYRLHLRVPGLARRTMDFGFPRERLAVFMDGCFWHGCPDHATSPRSNAAWWREKLDRNMARDTETTAHLRALGWTVLRFWEHETPEEAAAVVIAELRRKREERSAPPPP